LAFQSFDYICSQERVVRTNVYCSQERVVRTNVDCSQERVVRTNVDCSQERVVRTNLDIYPFITYVMLFTCCFYLQILT
jgi:hypothetical protein